MLLLLSIAFVALITGWQGLGVGFLALPVFVLFLPDFASQAQPHALLLSGVTAAVILATTKKKFGLDKKQMLILGGSAAIAAFVGGLMSRAVIDRSCIIMILYGYSILIIYIPFNFISKPILHQVNFGMVVIAATIVSLLASWMGVGPGYMLLPILVLSGLELKRSIAISAMVEILVSVFALLPRLAEASWQVSWLLGLILVAGLFAFLGASLSERYKLRREIRIIWIVGVFGLVLYSVFKVNNICGIFQGY